MTVDNFIGSFNEMGTEEFIRRYGLDTWVDVRILCSICDHNKRLDYRFLTMDLAEFYKAVDLVKETPEGKRKIEKFHRLPNRVTNG